MLDFQENVFTKVLKITWSWHGQARAKKGYVCNFYKDILLEVQNEKCS